MPSDPNAAPPPGDPPPHDPRSADADATASRVPNGNRRRLPRKKIWTPILLLVTAAIFAVIGLILYESATPSELPAPSYVNIALKSSFPIGIIGYTVDQGSGSAKIEIVARLSNAVNPPNSTETATLELTPPNTDGFLVCPNMACGALISSSKLLLYRDLIFTPGELGAETASVSFTVNTQAFGGNSNGLDASAAIPQVFYECSYSGLYIPVLQAQYNLHSAASYDWASFPVQQKSIASATWEEPVIINGETPGRVALGVDDVRQTRDDFFLFIAGALIAVAAGALLSAITEAVHATD